ncbi:gliding motility protein [Flavobacterium sp. SUN052]|uniref:type IX secretion system periplasmic lipoprotein PorW/SprE n=1 Tax=Flavobacterium sp. SUN052 TaxID=3002441 RepID=UPI00237D489B|nr:gliding motility protein [Flavobacterium sp. SUN052]MEC4003496.1 gliding motility protein [Flavobacterium sp. SUN052]
MKTSTFKYIIIITIVAFFVACSTKKNTFVSRNYNSLTTKDNILYNGGIALDKGIADLKSQFKDNFWQTLPVERMQITQEQMLPGQAKNANFERAETKATMAIQKHSMNIGGSEKNPQMDEAHLMLGKTRYYDQRFVPALEAFNYVLYKYPNSDKIYEVKIWREKTNMRMENDALAIINLRKLLKEIKFKDQIFADANATLAQAFLNLKEKDSAIAKLKLATEFTKSDEEKSRYRFILGQVYEEKGYKDSAFAKYQEVIDMKRKSARQYVIQAHARQAAQFDFANGDTLVFMKKYTKLLKDRENRPFLDVLNHQVALFYDKLKMPDVATKYYNTSLKKKGQDTYLTASNYRNLADIYFNKAKYVTAGKYFDSTLTVLNSRTREYKLIAKKRENLDDVIKFEGIAQRNDSILKVASFSPSERESYYKEYIDKLKKEEKKQLELAEKAAKASGENKDNGGSPDIFQSDAPNSKQLDVKPITPAPLFSNSETSTFYFYNPTTVAYGKVEFKKKWGDRAHVDNWRLSKETVKDVKNPEDSNDNADATSEDGKTKQVDEKYTTDFYLKQIPTSTKILDSIAKERNFAYYQLGVIYKEKFKEYKRAADKLEKLLENKPEERLVLPSMYNLYKIYEIIDPSKALAMKSKIISQYPDSRYAQIISNPNGANLVGSTPEVAYLSLYKEYEDQKYREVLPKTEVAIEQFTGEEMLPKFELLKANLVGKLKGLAEYKKALNYVALTYPNSEEGKETEVFIATKIPYLESLTFNSEFPLSWNILYKADNLEDKNTKALLEKLTKFAKERTIEKLTISTDIYTIDKNFIVIHGIKLLDNAKGIAQVLKEFKDYKIAEPAIVISSENYKVVQIKKNIDEYISGDWLNKPIIPVQRNIILPEVKSENNKKGDEQPKENQVIKNLIPQKGKGNMPNGIPDNPQKMDLNPQNSNDPALQNMMPPAPDMPKKP